MPTLAEARSLDKALRGPNEEARRQALARAARRRAWFASLTVAFAATRSSRPSLTIGHIS
jgi:hypothetical protein